MTKQKTNTKTKSVSSKAAKPPKYDAEIAELKNAQSIMEIKSIVMGFDQTTRTALKKAINDSVARIYG